MLQSLLVNASRRVHLVPKRQNQAFFSTFQLSPVKVSDWLEEHKEDFKPPVSNKMMENKQLKIMFVGGPNQREDFHIQEGEELFYQIKGDMVLKALVKDEIVDIPIKEGEMFMLPANIPHSPQRFENTMGLVIERERLPTEYDGLIWFVPGQKEILYDEYFYCADLGTELVPAMERFWQSEEYKTKVPRVRGEDNPVLTEPNATVEPNQPFSWSKFLQFKHEERSQKKHKMAGSVCNVFNGEFVTTVCMGEGSFSIPANTEVWVWQQNGRSRVSVELEGQEEEEGGEGEEGEATEGTKQGSEEAGSGEQVGGAGSEVQSEEGQANSTNSTDSTDDRENQVGLHEARTLTAKLGEDECVVIPKHEEEERTFSYKVKEEGSLFVIYSRAFSQ